MKASIIDMKEGALENQVYGFQSRLRKDSRSWIITLKKEIISGCGVTTNKPIFCQLIKYNNRLALLVFLDNKDYFGRGLEG